MIKSIGVVCSQINNLNFWTKIIAVFVGVFAPIATAVHTILFLIFIDLLTGIWASVNDKKKKNGFKANSFIQNIVYITDSIKSCKLRVTLNKAFGYIMLIIVFHLTDFYLIKLDVFEYNLTSIIQSFIGIIELKSIVENIARIQKSPVLLKLVGFLSKDFEQKYGISLKSKEEEKCEQ